MFLPNKNKYGNKRKYTLITDIDDYGPYFSVTKGKEKIGNANLIRSYDGYEFSIHIYKPKNFTKGIGTVLMSFVVNWASKNNAPYIFGKLSEDDKRLGNWEYSLPFYAGLQRKIPKIRETYFLRGIFDFVKNSNSVPQYAVDIAAIKSSNSGYIVFILS